MFVFESTFRGYIREMFIENFYYFISVNGSVFSFLIMWLLLQNIFNGDTVRHKVVSYLV